MYKILAINSLQWLVQKQLVKIYGYVILPNHIYLIWGQLKMNGKELSKNSFEKFTAKALLTNLQKIIRFHSLLQYLPAEVGVSPTFSPPTLPKKAGNHSAILNYRLY